MTSGFLRIRRLMAWGAVAALSVLGACGGGDELSSSKPSFTSVVSFGDSLSDVGSYASATSLTGNGQAPYFGGKFTTNSAQGTVWIENIAKALGLAITPHEMGFAGQSVLCPSSAQGAAATCTGYAQGGARVTDPNGLGKSGGALTVPVKTQIANHLSQFAGYTEHDLVFVYAGSNDAFAQFDTFTAVATTATDPATVAQAQAQAALAMDTAAQELAGYITASILGKGAKYVAVLGLPDAARTPLGASLPANVAPVLTALVNTFNEALRKGLQGQPVLWIDSNQIFADTIQNPAASGLVNVSAVACDSAKISALTRGAVTNGSSLFCNSTVGAAYNGMVTGADPDTWLWADGVHPTTGGHKALGLGVAKALKAAGWL